MRIEESYPTPVHGVSTLAPRNRARGQAGIQDNFRSDPVSKLTRRPSCVWDAFLVTTGGDEVKVHSYIQDDVDYKIIVKEDGTVYGFVDNVSKTVTGVLGTYVSTDTVDDMELQTINDTTFIINRKKEVAMVASTDEAGIENVSHINVTSAMNYGEVLTVTVILSWASVGPIDQRVVTYSIPLVGASTDFDAADQARATAKVAEEIALLLDAESGISAISNASSVAVWRDSGAWLEVEIQSGQGSKAIVSVNRKIEDVGGLPLFAVHGTRITVQPNPRSEKGTYYLEATGTSDSSVVAATFGARILEEVVWAEHRAPEENFSFQAKTMPHTIVYNKSTDDFTVGEPTVGWDDRRAGDDDSAPQPDFVGNTIQAMGYFQKRLVVVSNDNVMMSETDNLYSWWKASAVTLLVTDPIGIASSAADTDIIKSVLSHNKDLMAVASNGQFKINGDSAVTPQTVSMPLTTAYEVQTTIAPIAVGNSIYLPISYGDSSGIQEYSAEKDNTQDVARPVTNHIIGLLEGEINILAGNSNINMLAVNMKTISGSSKIVPSYDIFVFEYFRNSEGKPLQRSWSKWSLPQSNKILHMYFTKDRLNIVCLEGSLIITKYISLYSAVGVNTSEVYLDDLLTLESTDGLTVTVPTNYLVDSDIIVVGGDGTDYPLSKIEYTESGGVITFDENISGSATCSVYVGNKYTSKYQPTRPYKYDENNIIVTTDRLRVSKFILNIVNSAEVNMSITSDYSNYPDQEFNSRFVGGINNLIGEVPMYSGDVKFSYSQNADLATAEFYTDGFLPLNIAGISWTGQYHQSSRRM